MICNQIHFFVLRHLMPDGINDFPYLSDEIQGNTYLVRELLLLLNIKRKPWRGCNSVFSILDAFFIRTLLKIRSIPSNLLPTQDPAFLMILFSLFLSLRVALAPKQTSVNEKTLQITVTLGYRIMSGIISGLQDNHNVWYSCLSNTVILFSLGLLCPVTYWGDIEVRLYSLSHNIQILFHLFFFGLIGNHIGLHARTSHHF